METKAPGQWLTISQAAALAGVSRRTIYHWMDKTNKVRIARTPSGMPRVWSEDVVPKVQERAS